MKKTKDIQIYIKDEETFTSTYYNENYKKLLGNSANINEFPIRFAYKWWMCTQAGPDPAR